MCLVLNSCCCLLPAVAFVICFDIVVGCLMGAIVLFVVICFVHRLFSVFCACCCFHTMAVAMFVCLLRARFVL